MSSNSEKDVMKQNADLLALVAIEVTRAGTNGQLVELGMIDKNVTVKVLPPNKDDKLPTTSE